MLELEHPIKTSVVKLVTQSVPAMIVLWHGFAFFSKAEIPYTQYEACESDIAVAYATLWYPCVSNIPLNFWPISLGKACLETLIAWLIYKILDSNIQFWPIATWSDPFCHIRKYRITLL